MDQQKSKSLVWLLVLGIVLVGAYILFSDKGDEIDRSDMATDTSSFLRMGDNALFIADQRIGTTTVVNVVAAGDPGFVLIRRSGDSGDSVIGVSELLSKGEHVNVSIVTNEPLEANKKYVAELVVDDGNGRFDPSEGTNAGVDVSAKDSEGNPISMQFEALLDVPDPQSVEVIF